MTRRFASRSNPRVRLFEFENRFSNSLACLFEIEIRFPGTGVPFQIRKPVVRELDFENRIPILILVFQNQNQILISKIRIRFRFSESDSQNQILIFTNLNDVGSSLEKLTTVVVIAKLTDWSKSADAL